MPSGFTVVLPKATPSPFRVFGSNPAKIVVSRPEVRDCTRCHGFHDAAKCTAAAMCGDCGARAHGDNSMRDVPPAPPSARTAWAPTTRPRRLPVATPCRQRSLGQAFRYRKGSPPEDWPRPPQGRGGGPTPPPLGPGPAAPPAAPTIPVPTPALPKGYLFLEAEKRAAASLVTLLSWSSATAGSLRASRHWDPGTPSPSPAEPAYVRRLTWQ